MHQEPRDGEHRHCKYRRRKVGTTRASDVWSMGCLLYELLTNRFLFNDSDWLKFYTRITSTKSDILEKQNKEALGLFSDRNHMHLMAQRIVEFLESTLIRNPDLRPTASHMGRMFDQLLGAYASKIVPEDES